MVATLVIFGISRLSSAVMTFSQSGAGFEEWDGIRHIIRQTTFASFGRVASTYAPTLRTWRAICGTVPVVLRAAVLGRVAAMGDWTMTMMVSIAAIGTATS